MAIVPLGVSGQSLPTATLGVLWVIAANGITDGRDKRVDTFVGLLRDVEEDAHLASTALS